MGDEEVEEVRGTTWAENECADLEQHPLFRDTPASRDGSTKLLGVALGPQIFCSAVLQERADEAGRSWPS